jgi:hypothetical protein
MLKARSRWRVIRRRHMGMAALPSLTFVAVVSLSDHAGLMIRHIEREPSCLSLLADISRGRIAGRSSFTVEISPMGEGVGAMVPPWDEQVGGSWLVAVPYPFMGCAQLEQHTKACMGFPHGMA